MKLCCTTCGYRSADVSFFRRERWGIFALLRPVCAGCCAYRPTIIERRALSGLIGWQVFAWAFYLFRREIAEFAFLEEFAIAWLLTTAMHEFGHAVVANTLGCHIISVNIGSGPALWRRWRGGAVIVVGCYTFTGGKVHYLESDRPLGPGRRAMVAFAGPAANLCASAILILCAAAISRLDTYGDSDIAVATLSGLAISQVCAAIFNLIPRTHKSGLLSDGAQILQAFKSDKKLEQWQLDLSRGLRLALARRFVDAEAAFKSLLDCPLGRPAVLSMVIHYAYRGRGGAKVVEFYRENQEFFDAAEEATAEQRESLSYVHATLAWAALNSGLPSALLIAENFARRAYEVTPDAPAMKGTLGALLVTQGEIDRGAELLLDAVREMTDPLDRADLFAFLAKSERARGVEARANDFEGLERHNLAIAGWPKRSLA
jgi:Zn-dependent protease